MMTLSPTGIRSIQRGKPPCHGGNFPRGVAVHHVLVVNRTGSAEGLFDISQQVGDVFDADGQAYEVFGHFERRARR